MKTAILGTATYCFPQETRIFIALITSLIRHVQIGIHEVHGVNDYITCVLNISIFRQMAF